MTVPQRIVELVERFENNKAAYRAGQYNETQLRREFLDPFFDALGWDMENKQSATEIYKEVIHEYSTKVNGRTEMPDYCFRIAGREKFYVEAKKPSVNIGQATSPAYQLRKYAWNQKLPISILTDFEEFAVYDCRIKPIPKDKPSTARILYFTYSEYLDRWEEIATLFSRDAIIQGAIDRYVDEQKGQRRTQTVDAVFLEEIESWRKTLAMNIAKKNTLNQRQLNYAVQMTIDRIIFLRICEDRNIERYEQLKDIAADKDVYAGLCRLFYRADERYNSGLFHFQNEQGQSENPDELTPNLTVDDKPLKEIIRNLYEPYSPYLFSIFPTDVLGQVYERFLGKVIVLTSPHSATVEDKPEVRQARGVYYTPTYIVEYIVEKTVGRLCEGKTPKQVASLRILDPACGSGSFLLGAYQYLLEWHLAWYVNDGVDKHKKLLHKDEHDEWRLTTAERKRILLNNIYGVDIDTQAVEVTKLSLLLKVLEGESSEAISAQLRIFHERALPDLASNIKSGNSLIESDYYNNVQMNFLDEEELYRINVFDWADEFPKIMGAGGFDVVIGNPPYGAYLYETDKGYLNAKYSYQNYQLDSYLLFLERAIRKLLRNNGLYGMIIPNPWLTNLRQRDTRKFIASSTKIFEIVHFRFAVFPKVTVDTEILILEKAKPVTWQTKVTVAETPIAFKNQNNKGIKLILHKQQKWIDLQGGVINIFTSESEEALAKKCLNSGVPVSSLCDINVGIKPYQVGKGKPPQTRDTVESRPYDSNVQLDKSYKPYLRGSDINRYVIAPLEPRFLKYGDWLAEPRPAANFSASVKIFMRQTGDSLVATLDTEGYLCLNNMHVLVPKGTTPTPEYILGILNSKLLNWYYHTLNPEVGEALAEVKKANVAVLPIRVPNPSSVKERGQHDQLAGLVDSMLSLHKKLITERTAQGRAITQRLIGITEKQIDQLVYELYDLTADERTIVETGT